MFSSSRAIPVVAVFLLFALTAHPLGAERRHNDNGQGRQGGLPSQPIRVDCTRGESLQRALDGFPERTEQITIEIHGLCQEQIGISRKVIIRGTDPATDGITGPADLGIETGLVVIFGISGFGTPGSEMVRLEHLTVTGSPGIGITVNNAQVGLTNVRVTHNRHGLIAFSGAFVYARDLASSDNSATGVYGAGGNINCNNCQITNNGSLGGPSVIGAGSRVFLNNPTITGLVGVQAAGGGEILIVGGSIHVTHRAANAASGGRLFFQNDVQLSGSVICSLQGALDSRKGSGTIGLNQLTTASGGSNQIANGCFFLAGPGTTNFAGQTVVGAGGYVGTEGPPGQTTVKFTQLGCSNGGKVTTTGGTIVVNNVAGIPAGCAP